MILENLLDGLQHTNILQRLNAVIVLGTVDEVDAISTMVAAFKVEPEADVKQAMAWAGKRLQAARQSNHSTLEAIFQHFRIVRTLAADEEERERRLIEQMKFKADMEHQQRQDDNLKGAVATTIVSTAMFGITGLMSGIGGASPSGADYISSNLGEDRPKIGRERIMPTRPGDSDIRQSVRRLRDESDPSNRASAALNLSRLVNNPDALPELASAFIDDPAAVVKVAAQKAAKEIYWNVVYWEMEQDGRMAAEIARRGGKAVDSAVSPVTSVQDAPKPAQPSPGEIAAILRKAEAKREKRKRF